MNISFSFMFYLPLCLSTSPLTRGERSNQILCLNLEYQIPFENFSLKKGKQKNERLEALK